jgi:hypothetical protein
LKIGSYSTLLGEQSVDDGLGVVAFKPSVGGDLAFAGAVGAGVHHNGAVTGAKEKFGLADDPDAVVGNAVEKEHPIAVGMVGADNPASEEDAVGGADVEVFAVAAGMGEGGVGLTDKVGREFAAHGMKKARCG